MFKNLITLALSGLVTLLLGEAAVRVAFDPVDYLLTTPVRDPVLAHKIAPGRAGHDDWGYRNPDVPDQAEILALGDSMTYGLMAKMRESWPLKLGEMTGKSVYNAGLGGYGPLQYLHVLKTRSEALSPKQAVVMIYLGNDLLDTYNLINSYEFWADYRLREKSEEEIASNVFANNDKDLSLARQIRGFLAHNSVLYRMVLQAPVFDGIRKREAAAKMANGIEIEHLGMSVLLDPEKRLRIANIEDPRIQEALEVSKRAMRELVAFADENDIALHVVLMPVREHVFNTLIGDTLTPEQQAHMTALAQSLEAIEAEFAGFFEAEGLDWTNLRPVLETGLADANIFPPTDGHPNAAGYALIAETLSAALAK